MFKAIPWLLVTTGLAVTPFTVFAKTEAVINLNVKHSVAGKDTFERSKHMKLHSTIYDNDWNGEEDKLKYMMEDLDVYFGRDNGSSVWNFNQAKQDENRPGYADSADIIRRGKQSREVAYGVNKSSVHKYDERGDLMVGGQPRQHFLGKTSPCCGNGEGWQANGGDAIGEFLGQYINEFFRSEGQAATNGHPRPIYLEILNEPLYQVTDAPHELGLDNPIDPIKVFEFHNTAAEGVRKYNTDVKIGGFTVAFPIFEERNFARWSERMKLFIDTSGEYMDVYSTHFYDLEDSNKFKGSRLEATLDMVDHYSMVKLGHTKEHLISEYGGRNRNMEREQWSPLRDWWFLKAASPMLLQFLDRPDSILTSIPFVPIKALWGTNGDIPYNWRLLRQAKEGVGEEGEDWVFTEMVKFYELWSDVNGTRVDTFTTNPNILIDSYVDENKAYVIISNLTSASENVLLHKLGNSDAQIQSVKIKHLYLDGTKPKLDVINASADTDNFDLAAEATIIVEYTYDTDLNIDAVSDEKKYFATEYLKEISPNVDNTFVINDVTTSDHGEAILRIALGRDIGSFLNPTVTFNGQILNAKARLSGDDQSGRPRFFGLVEIPVPYNLVQTNNTVAIRFPDAGGHIASVNMKVFNFDRNIRSEGGEVTGIFISSPASVIAVGETLQLSASVTPFFATDKTFTLTSNDPSVASVDSNGLVSALTAGEVTITATSTNGNFEASTTLTVEEPVAASFSFDDRNQYISNVYKTDDVMKVTTHYEAGTGLKVSNNLGGVVYLLRYMSKSWQVIKDIKVVDASAVGKQRGTSVVNIPLNGLTPTADLENGEFYFLFVRFENSAGVVKNVSALPINIEKDDVAVEPLLAFDDVEKYRNTVFTTDSTLDVTATFEAGLDNLITDALGGVKFYLRELTPEFGLVNDVQAADGTAVGEQSGKSTVSIPLSGLTPSSELAEGNFYYLFAQFKTLDGSTQTAAGIFPITIEQGVIEPSFAVDDTNKYKTTEYQVGGEMEVTVNFEMGTGNTVAGEGIKFFLRQLRPGYIPEKDIVITDSSVVGQQSGTSVANIPLTGALASADLPEGHFYFLFMQVTSSDGSKQNIAIHHPIILGATSIKGDYDGDGDVDINDIRGLVSAMQKREKIDTSFDLNGDNKINITDARMMMSLCTQARCAAL